jgi:hypothetical protein
LGQGIAYTLRFGPFVIAVTWNRDVGRDLERSSLMQHSMTLKREVKRSAMKWGITIFSALLFLVLPLAANSHSGTDEGHGVSFSLGESWRGVISPGGSLYPLYIANPIRPTMAFNRVAVSDSGIAEAGDTRYTLRLGGRVNLLRAHPAGEPDRGFQMDVEAAFLGQFDADHSLDNIGWDGIWGLALTWADGAGLAAKLATQHDSSHVGDEYAERTGRERINYTRAEVVCGLSVAFSANWRVYGEAGYAYDRRNVELQKPWRLEGGLEFEDAHRLWKGRLGYYAAVDITAYEESDWQRDITIQAGILLPVTGLVRTYRFGIEYRDGRSIIGEFFQDQETSWALGLWVDW